MENELVVSEKETNKEHVRFERIIFGFFGTLSCLSFALGTWLFFVSDGCVYIGQSTFCPGRISLICIYYLPFVITFFILSFFRYYRNLERANVNNAVNESALEPMIA
jgi:hypothetical protein